LTESNFSTSINGSGIATTTFQLGTAFLYGLANFTVDITHPPDAALLSDSRVKWFIDAGWHRYTYYGISPAVSVTPGTTTCPTAGGAECLTVTNLPSDNGLTDDKKFVLALTGNAVTTTANYVQTQPSANYLDYLESHTAGSRIYTPSSVNVNFNDRFATCPFQQTPASGVVTLC
jgi:hypothetical protein